MVAGGDGDETVRLTRPRGRARLRRTWWILAVLLVVGGVGVGIGLWLPRPTPVPRPVPAPVRPIPKPVPQPVPEFAIHTAGEAAILADRPERLTVFRFAPNRHVLVLDFPTLREQGLMLDRVAALIEKAGLPRDRVLTNSELDAAIRASGDTLETYYYGHDYRAADLARFFVLANRDHVVLSLEEEELRRLLRQVGWLSGETVGALISIPRAGTDKVMTEAARATILHHELSHGEYFTNPAYAAFTRHFWHSDMTEDDRAHFRAFLGSEGYDTGLEDLMMNEMQAYLMHTPNPEFFNARAVGLSEDRLDRLRAVFLADMPRGWLRDETPAPALPVGATPVRAPSRRPERSSRRRRQRRGPVFSTTASTANRASCRRAAAIAA